jgi:flagellar protein FlaG
MATSEITASLASRAVSDLTGVSSRRVAALEPAAQAPAPSPAGHAGVTAPGEVEVERSSEVQAPTEADVQESVGRLNDLMQIVRRELHFSVDEDSGRTVIKVIDSETQQIVRSIPPEEVMTLVERFSSAGPSSLLQGLKA